MVTTAQPRSGASTRSANAVTVGGALVVAELLLAALWFPWVVEHLAFGRVRFDVVRLLIVGPEYLLLALAVHRVALTRERRTPAVGLALLAGLVAWGLAVGMQHLASDPAARLAHHRLLTALDDTLLVVVPSLAALAWGVSRRAGRWWLLAVPVAPLLNYWLARSSWASEVQLHFSFRGAEVWLMSLVILPVLLAVLAGWALEQVETSRSAHDEGPPPPG